MARLDVNSFRNWDDGNVMGSSNYEQERSMLIEAINSNFDQAFKRYEVLNIDGTLASTQSMTDAVNFLKFKQDSTIDLEHDSVNSVLRIVVRDAGITEPKIANQAVTRDKIGPYAVTSDKLADAVITTSKIVEGNVTTSKIANQAVTVDKIADSAVTATKLGNELRYTMGNRETWTATEGQTVFNLVNGAYTPGAKTLEVWVGGVRQSLNQGYTETSSTSFTLAEGVPVGTRVEAIWREGLTATTDITKQIGYKENVADKLGILSKTLNATLTGTNIELVDTSIISLTNEFRIVLDANNPKNVTFKTKPLKIYDRYSDVYRNCPENLLTENIPYKVKYDSTNDYYIIEVETIYSHLLIECGTGKEFTELHDAISFAGQFKVASFADEHFYRYPYAKKGQISILIPNTTSVMTKQVRMAENHNLHIEVVNENRYKDNWVPSVDKTTAIIDFQGTLGTDDQFFINLWKTSIHEFRGLTIKCNIPIGDKQGVFGAWYTDTYMKDCIIDITGATLSGTPRIYMINGGTDNGFTNQIKMPTTANTANAVYTTGNITAMTITGKSGSAFYCDWGVSKITDSYCGEATNGITLSNSQVVTVARVDMSQVTTKQVNIANFGVIVLLDCPTFVVDKDNYRMVNKWSTKGMIVTDKNLNATGMDYNTISSITNNELIVKAGQLNYISAVGSFVINDIKLSDFDLHTGNLGHTVQIQLAVVSGTTLTLKHNGSISRTKFFKHDSTDYVLDNGYKIVSLIWNPFRSSWNLVGY